MKKLSGFTFIHNALESGYPIIEAIETVREWADEVVVADCESDDGTTELLQALGVKTIQGKWGNKAGVTLAQAHLLHLECEGDIIIHFEADEVYDKSLLSNIVNAIESGKEDIAVYRLQLEQNFQRCRWYPELVHRVFPKGTVIKDGHTTDRHCEAAVLGPEKGMLWDITNCFRDNWLRRVENQAELWNDVVQFQGTRVHFKQDAFIENVDKFLSQPDWTWQTTPFSIPEILRPLLGVTDYRESKHYKVLIP